MQCVTCGSTIGEGLAKCSRCGADLSPSGNGAAAAAAAGQETVAIAAEEPRRPSSSSASSRLTTTSTPEEGRFPPGTLLAGRYRVIELLGRGGMGEVYRATDLTLGQSVALKFLPEDANINERLLERFHNEVRTARQVSHPNVCRVFDIGEADGLPFISMEYVDGEDLASLLQRIGRLAPDKALQITRKLCAGVAAAHERGIMHRDLKPQNVMLNKRGEIVVMDFGLAAIADQLEGAEARTGTPAYMSPEQLRGAAVTFKSDLYSLGLIVYELFTGKRAYEAKTVADLLRAEESARPAGIVTLAPDVDPAVEKVVLRCLHPDPQHRPPNALAISAALPGGDPLAAALAAGETPSPELVAASGKTEGFKLRYAVPCLVFVLLGLLTAPFVVQPMSMVPVLPMDFPHDVLQQKARDFAATVGYTAKPVDWKTWFRNNPDVVNYFRDSKVRGNLTWAQIAAAESPLQFEYRESPKYLLSPPDGSITRDRPPMNVPGMVRVLMDSGARLREFEAVPVQQNDAGVAPAALDPAPLFRQAGLDFSKFHQVAPIYVPAHAFDTRQAWSGPVPGLPGVEVTVEAASWHGALTSFYIHWPWTKPVKTTEDPWDPKKTAMTIIQLLLPAMGLLFTIVVARKNLRVGRVDRQGAFRFAAAALLFFILTVMLSLHITPTFSLLGYFLEGLFFGIGLCSLLWLLYIALEPAVRARWPHSLITWNRLLAGQVGDPRLGSHILIGVTMALALTYLFVLRTYWILGHGGVPDMPDVDYFMGVKEVIHKASNNLFNALLNGAGVFFLLCGLRALLRRDWLAALAAAVILTFENVAARPANLAVDIPLFMAVGLGFSFALLRMGLVPMILILLVINTMGNLPMGADFSAWYNPATVFGLAFVAALAVYGFWRSQASAEQPGLSTTTSSRYTWA